MFSAIHRLVKLLLGLTWLVGVALVLALAALSQIAPKLGQELVIIRGSSMAPALPTGSLIGISAVQPDGLRVGDVVTVRLDRTEMVTHRIVGIESSGEAITVRTQGDANPTADPDLRTADEVVGRVSWQVPFAGFALAFLSAPAGMVATISFLGALLVAAWLLDELGWGRAQRPMTPEGVSGEASV